MGLEEIRTELAGAVADILGMETGELDTSAMLMDIGMDSLGLVETFVYIEKNFGLRLLETGIKREEMESIDALSSYIAGLKRA